MVYCWCIFPVAVFWVRYSGHIIPGAFFWERYSPCLIPHAFFRECASWSVLLSMFFRARSSEPVIPGTLFPARDLGHTITRSLSGHAIPGVLPAGCGFSALRAYLLWVFGLAGPTCNEFSVCLDLPATGFRSGRTSQLSILGLAGTN